MPKTCFVVGPIGDAGTETRTHADWVLRGIIKPVFESHFPDFEVIRSDGIATPGMIDAQVITHLLDDDLVVADMTSLNANAFYEMGIRHMQARPIIHMFKTGQPIPFDVKPYRAIEFNYAHPDDLENAKTALKLAVDETQREGFQVENPVTRARGVQQFQETATPEGKLLLGVVETLSARISVLEAASGQFPPSAIWQSKPRKTAPWRFYVKLKPESRDWSELVRGEVQRTVGQDAQITGDDVQLEVRLDAEHGEAVQSVMSLIRQIAGVEEVHTAEKHPK